MCDAMLEAARGSAPYADVEAAGLAAVAPEDVMPGVRELVDDVRVEVLFGDGPRLVVLIDPLGAGRPASIDGPGAVMPVDDGSAAVASGDGGSAAAADGDPAWMLPPATLERRSLVVENTSRRVVRISSHYPFERVNPRLVFDRAQAAGFHLDLPAGSSERWSPGDSKEVRLVRYARDGHETEGHGAKRHGAKGHGAKGHGAKGHGAKRHRAAGDRADRANHANRGGRPDEEPDT